jgi:hypothetical protein
MSFIDKYNPELIVGVIFFLSLILIEQQKGITALKV